MSNERGVMTTIKTPQSSSLFISYLDIDLEMSGIRQLADGNVRSELNRSGSGDASESNLMSALRKAAPGLMMIRSIHTHWAIDQIFEPFIRRIVKEQIELGRERIWTSMNQNSGNEIPPSEPTNLQLRFQNRPSQLVLTGSPIEAEDSTSVKLDLVDVYSGEVVKFGPEAFGKVEIVVEEFNQKIATETLETQCRLIGDTVLKLKEGIGSVGKIYFPHRAKWVKRRQLRLQARLVDNSNGTRVKDAKSEPFFLEDCRNKLYKKHFPPLLKDKVWRLKNIHRHGPLYKRLSKAKIETVEVFLTQYFINRQGLQDILGTGMSDEKLRATVEHGLTCKLDDKYFYHSPSSQEDTGVVFNEVGQLLGVLSECHFVSIEYLSETKKADAQKLVVSAFEHGGENPRYYENSVLCGSSHSENALPPSNSPVLKSPSDLNAGTIHMISGNDHLEPGTSSLGIISSNDDIGTYHMVSGHDHTQPSTSSTGIISSNDSIGRTNSMDVFSLLSICDMELLSEPSGDMGQVLGHQMFDPSSLFRDFDVDEDVRCHKNNSEARRKWFIMIGVLKFSVRIEDSDHVRKKQRFH